MLSSSPSYPPSSHRDSLAAVGCWPEGGLGKRGGRVHSRRDEGWGLREYQIALSEVPRGPRIIRKDLGGHIWQGTDDD